MDIGIPPLWRGAVTSPPASLRISAASHGMGMTSHRVSIQA